MKVHHFVFALFGACLVALSVVSEAALAEGNRGFDLRWSEGEVRGSFQRTTSTTVFVDLMVFKDVDELSFRVTPSVSAFVSVSPERVKDVAAGDVVAVKITVKPGAETRLGVNNGTLHAVSGNRTLPEVLKLRLVVEPAPEFLPPDEEGPEDHSPYPVKIAQSSWRPYQSESTINASSYGLVLELEGGQFSSERNRYTVLKNGKPTTFWIISGRLHVPYAMSSTFNRIEVLGYDTEGGRVETQYEFWAGNQRSSTSIRNADGSDLHYSLMSFVTARIARAPHASFTKRLNGGALPSGLWPIPLNEPVILEFSVSDGRRYSTVIVDTNSRVQEWYTFRVPSIMEPAQVPNIDFSGGTLTGWEKSQAPRLYLVPHDEEGIPDVIASLRSVVPLVAERRVTSAEETNTAFSPASSTPIMPASLDGGDLDLVLGTYGAGLRRTAHAFRVEGASKAVTVRYRFITFEVPAGYYDSEFNDYFTVSAGSQTAGTYVGENLSMNSFGLGAFDENGVTAWRELSLPIAGAGDVVQVDLGVANVGDGQLDSFIQVDLVAERPLRIADAYINDDPGTYPQRCVNYNAPRAMRYLSYDYQPYVSGETGTPVIPIFGWLALEGPADGVLDDVKLEVLVAGEIINEGELTDEAAELLLTEFGEDELILVDEAIRLFDIPVSDPQTVAENRRLQLRVRASMQTSAGEISTTHELGTFEQLIHQGQLAYRYLGRNEAEGGDSWTRPGLRAVFEHFNQRGLYYGDFTNMHGGAMSPHCGHFDGARVDAWFEGLSAKDAAAAARIINYLNDPLHGSRIQLIQTTFDNSDASEDPFWLAIRDVLLDDGRRAQDVIRPIERHPRHMHMIFSP